MSVLSLLALALTLSPSLARSPASQKADSARETAVHLRMQVERARNEIHAFEDIILQTKKELEILKRDKEL